MTGFEDALHGITIPLSGILKKWLRPRCDGNFRELLDANGTFARMWQLQQQEEARSQVVVEEAS